MCDDAWKPALGQSVFFVGSLIGSLGFGILADRIGRLHVLVAANVCAFVGNFITIFANDAITYGCARFVAGCATDTNFVMMYMIGMRLDIVFYAFELSADVNMFSYLFIIFEMFRSNGIHEAVNAYSWT